MKSITLNDHAGSIHGHWRLDVYEGDIVRAQIPLWQRAYNFLADIRWKLFRIPSRRYFRGEVLNRHIETMEGDNLVVTVGKQLILDRIFGLSSVAAVSRTGVGTSATAAAIGNTSLTGGVFKSFDSTPVRSSLTVTTVTTFGTSDANISWNETGMDNGTTLLNRLAPIGPYTKTSGASIILTATLTQS